MNTASNFSKLIKNLFGLAQKALSICFAVLLSVSIVNAQNSWTVVKDGSELLDVTYANNLYVAVGNKGSIKTSSDGVTWTSRTSGVSQNLSGVVYIGGKYIVIYQDQATAKVKTIESTNGINWSAGTVVFTFPQHAYGNSSKIKNIGGVLVAFGDYQDMMSYGDAGWLSTSTDGTTWVQKNLPTVTQWGQTSNIPLGDIISIGSSQYLAVSLDFTKSYTTSDFSTWTTGGALAQWGYSSSLALGNNTCVAVSGSNIYTSSNLGTSWVSRTSGLNAQIQLKKVVYVGSKFIVIGGSGTIITSSDGITWTSSTSNVTNDLNSISDNGLIAVGKGNTVIKTTNQSLWTVSSEWTFNDFRKVAFGNGVFVALGNNTGYTSSDGFTWNKITDPDITNYIYDLIFANGKFIAIGQVGNSMKAYISSDGLNWSATTLPSAALQLCYGQNTLFATGQAGRMAKSTDMGATWSDISQNLGVLGNPVFDNVNNRFIFAYQNNRLYTSSDLTNFTATTVNPANIPAGNLGTMTFTNGKLFCSGYASTLTTSSNLTNWTTLTTTPNGSNLGQGLYIDGKYYFPAGDGQLLISSDGVTFTTENTGSTQNLNSIAYGNGIKVAVGYAGSIVTSGGSITTTGTLAAFTKCESNVSASQSLVIAGSYLTSDITVTAPTGFECSTDNSNFTTSVTIPQTGGNASGTVYFRMTAASTGSITGNVVLSSTGVSNVNVPVSGAVTIPTAGTLSGTQAICVAGTSQFASTVSGGSWASSNTSIASVSTSGVVTGVDAGTATMTYTVLGTNGCPDASETRTVTVTAAPNAGTLSGTAALCINATSQFASTTTGGSWTSSNTSVATISSTGLVTAVATGTSTITYTVTGTGGCANVSNTRTVTVSTPPTAATLAGTQNVCVGGTTEFTATSSAGSWSTSNTAVATVSSTGLVTAVSAGTATISYTIAGTGGCADVVSTRTVTITAPPTTGTLSGTQTVFVGATTTYASTSTGGSWTSSNTAVATVDATTGVITGVAIGTATITYTVAGTGGCSDGTATRTVTVSACPNISAVSSSAYPVCAESTTTLTAAGLAGMSSLSSGITFKYSNTALADPYVGGTVIATVPFASLEAANTIARTTTSFAAGGTYYIYAILSTTPSGTTCRPSASTTLVVNPKGQVTLPASSVVCHGTSISAQTLTTTNSGGTTTYAWTNSATSIGLAASGSTATIPAFTATNTGSAGVTATIAVTPTYTDGGLSCPGATSSYTVTVNPVPALSSVANQVICNASTGAVSFNSTTNPAQTLSVSSGAISVTIPDGNAAGITNALTATIPTGATITGIAVNFNITHTWNSDMIINLVAPNGQILNLVNGRGGSSDNFTNTTISSASTTSLATGTAPFTGTFAADAASGVGPTSFLSNAANFAALYSGTTSGSWRLALRDRFSGDVGTLTSWSITFTYTPVPSVSWTNSNTAIGLAASGTGNISFTATNPGPDQISSTITATPTYDNAGLTCSGTPITFTVAVNPSGQVNAVSNQVLCNTSATSAVTFSTTNNGLISTGGTQTATSGTISVTVPDASAAGATHTIPVSLPTGAVINNMRVTLNLTHTWISDMVINLKAPNGQVLNLFNQHGGLGDNLVNTVVSSTGTTSFTSSSAPFTGTFAATAAQNQGPTGYASNAANFAALYSTPNGNWVLALRDLFLGDVGVLTSWSISFDYTVQGTFGTNMNWTNSNATIGLAATGTGNIPSFTAVNNGGTPIVSTVTVTPSYFNGGTSCPGTPTTFTYTVNPTPTVNAVAGQVFCAGTPSTVSFSGIAAGTVYSWTNSNTAIGLAASGTGNLSFTPTNTGTTPIIATITVTPSFTNAGVTCTGTPRTFTITVNPVGQANAVLSQVLCNGSNTTAVNFATVNGGGTIVAGTPVVTNSGTIAVVVPDANAAGASHTIPVTLPAGATVTGVSVNFNMNHTWVSDMVFNLKAPNGQILNLVNRRGGAGVNFTNTTISSAGTASLATGTAPFTGTFAADAAIGVGPTGQLSSAANYAALYTVGSGDWTLQMRDYVGGDVGTLTSWSITINYTTLVPAVTSYAWTNNLSSIGLAASGTGNIASFAATNTTAAPVTATVTVTPTYTNAGVGCAGTPISYTYTVNPTPTVNAVSNQTVCVGSNVAAVTFTGATTGTVYNWTNSNTAIGLAASGTGNIASFVGTNTTAAPISGTITVTPVYTNAGITCTGTPRTFTITVNPIPTVNPVANFAACHNTTAAAAFSGATTGTVFNWTNSNPAIGLPASGSGNISFTALNTTSAPVTATITVTPSFTNGGTTCVGTPTSFVITVNPLPVVTTGTLPGRICISDTLVRLNGTPVGGSWSGFGISGFNFMPPATDVGTWPITYTYADANGCVNRATTNVTVLACEERNRDLDNGAVILYPNPNSGQFNLRVNSTRFNVLGMKVYNTTGQLVYVNQWRGLVFARVIPVNLNNLAAGTYMVRLYYGDGMDRGADKTYQVIIAR